MPASTPFDSSVTITWDIEQPINKVLELHTAVSGLDRALEQNISNAGSWAIRFTERIGLVHGSFLQVIGDIQAMQQAMDKAGTSTNQQQVGVPTTYRLPDQATPPLTYSQIPPDQLPNLPRPLGSDISPQDWQWAMKRMALGQMQGGVSPNVMATSGFRMQLDQGYGQNWGGFSPSDPFINAQGQIIPQDQLQALRRTVAGQDYSQYQRIAALSPNAGNYDAIRAQAAQDQQDNIAAQRAQGQAEYEDVRLRAIATRNAQQGLVRSEYDQGSRYLNLQQQAGLTGSFESNISSLRDQATQALPGIMDEQGAQNRAQARADYEEDRQRILRVNQATKENTDANKENAGSVDNMGSALLRHIGYVAQAALIWGSLQAAQQFLKQMVTDVQQLEATSARLSFINPLGSAGAQYAQAARYGVGMTDAAGGILAGAQGGATAAQRNQAGQLAEVFGANQYTQAMQELIQTEKRATDAGLDHVNVMGYMATAYKTAPTDMKANFDALQLGITMYKELGLTAEQTGLMLLQASTALGQSPDQVANVMERLVLRLSDVKVQQQLAASYGIKGTDPTDLLRQVSATVAKDPSGSQGLMTFLTQGLGIQGPRTLLDMTTALVEFNKAATASATPLANIKDLTSTIDKTGTQAFQNLKASADAFLASLIQLEAQKAPLQVLMDLLNPGKALGAGYSIAVGDANALAKALQQQADVNAYTKATGKSPYGSDNPTGPAEGPIKGTIDGLIMGLIGGLLPGGVSGKILNFLNPNKSNDQYTPEYLAWLDKQNSAGQGNGYLGSIDRGPLLKAAPSSGLTAASPFGGFQDLPKNFDWDKFQSDLKKYSAQLSKDVPDYVQNPQEVAFWDASKGYYRTATADSQVVQRALQDQADALKQITGVFNVPSTGEVLIPFFALQSGMVPSTDPRLRNQAGHNGLGPRTGAGAPAHESAPGGLTAGIDPNWHFTDPAQIGVMDYLKVHGFSATAQSCVLSQTGSLPALSARAQEQMGQKGASGPSSIIINNRNVIMLNSRIIYDEMQHQMQSALTQTRRGIGGGAGSSYTIG